MRGGRRKPSFRVKRRFSLPPTPLSLFHLSRRRVAKQPKTEEKRSTCLWVCCTRLFDCWLSDLSDKKKQRLLFLPPGGRVAESHFFTHQPRWAGGRYVARNSLFYRKPDKTVFIVFIVFIALMGLVSSHKLSQALSLVSFFVSTKKHREFNSRCLQVQTCLYIILR